MSLSTVIILSVLIFGIIIGVSYAIIIKVYGIDSFSIFRRELYDKKDDDDEFYNRF